MDFALRPYPAGGALYELEVYAVVAVCSGLSLLNPGGDRDRRRLGKVIAFVFVRNDDARFAPMVSTRKKPDRSSADEQRQSADLRADAVARAIAKRDAGLDLTPA
jgi:hypothetical protein